MDVASIALDGAAFRALPAAHQRAVREAKAYAEKSFGGMTPAPRVLVTSSAGNGGEPVTVIVPPGAQAPLRVHTHYHGDRAGSVSGENAAADAVAARVKSGDRTVYVLPEARSVGTPTGWGNVRDLDRTAQDALAAAGLGRADVGDRTVSAHSAGGRALVQGTADGQTITADQLIIQDALYEGPSATHSKLKAQLPAALIGVGRVIIVPSADTSTSGPRARELAAVLRGSWNDVVIAPTARSHGAAAAVLDAPARAPVQGGSDEDRFERR